MMSIINKNNYWLGVLKHLSIGIALLIGSYESKNKIFIIVHYYLVS